MWNIFIGLIAVMLANILLGASLSKIKEEFNKEILFNGIFKAVMIVISIGLIYLCGYLNPDIATIEINGAMVNLVEGIKLIVVTGIIYYGGISLKKLTETIKISTNIKNENKENIK